MKKKYRGVSLVEMLITMFIISIVMILSSVTLTTLIRASSISSSRTTARNESEFMLELLKKSILNSQPDEVKLFKPTTRFFDENTQKVVTGGAAKGEGGPVEGYEAPLAEGEVGTEIHFRPVGFSNWICLGFFPGVNDPTRGYILKTSRTTLTDDASCFDSAQAEYIVNTVVLSSEEIDVNSLSLSYYKSSDDNLLLTAELDVEPIFWVASTSGIKPQYIKQVVMSTQKLTWEN